MSKKYNGNMRSQILTDVSLPKSLMLDINYNEAIKQTALELVLAKKAAIEANKNAELAIEKAKIFFIEAVKSANAAADAANAKLLAIQKERLSQLPQKSSPLTQPVVVQVAGREVLPISASTTTQI